jgi:hypothetical protein
MITEKNTVIKIDSWNLDGNCALLVKTEKEIKTIDFTFEDVYGKKSTFSYSVNAKELFENYPLSTIVNNCEYKLRRVSKKFDSLEDAYRAYGKAISWKPETHKNIIELINWGKDNNYQFTTLDSFIIDNDWLNIAAMKDNSVLNNNTVKLI